LNQGTRTPGKRALVLSVAVLGGLAAAWAVQQHQWRAVWNNLTGVPVASLAAALFCVLCQLGFQAARLRAIIPRNVALTLGRVAHAFAVGEWINIFTPARGGDALKVVLLNRAAGADPISLPIATGAVLADKIVDAGSLVLLFAATGFAGVARAGAQASIPAPGILLGTAVVVALLCLGVQWARPRWFERLMRLRRELASGLSALQDPVKVLASIALGIGAWVAELLALRVLCGALGFPLSAPQIVLALVILNLGISVPVSMANLGVYEAVLALGLHQSGVPLVSAVAIATVHHGLELLGTNLGAAGISLWVARSGPGGW
jgi:uncharacterized membrane protein YbhN (UPF0104 family)